MATKLPRRPDGFLNGSQLPIDDQNETFWMPLGRHDNFGRHQIAKKSPQKKKKKNVKTLKKINFLPPIRGVPD